MTSFALGIADPGTVRLVLEGEWATARGRGKKKTWKVRPWIHPSLNEWAQTAGVRGRYRVKAMKEAWDAKVREASVGAGRIIGPVVVTVTSYIPVDRNEDIDNRTPKFILDALVDAEVIEDDGRRIVRELRIAIEVDRTRPRTEVEIRTWTPPFDGVRKMLAPARVIR